MYKPVIILLDRNRGLFWKAEIGPISDFKKQNLFHGLEIAPFSRIWISGIGRALLKTDFVLHGDRLLSMPSVFVAIGTSCSETNL